MTPQSSSLWKDLQRDVYRIRGVKGWKEIARHLFGNRAYRAVFTYRISHNLADRRFLLARLLFPFAGAMHRWTTGAICSEIPIHTRIGAGLLLQHGYCVVINKNARIDEDVTIFHGVTIGATAKGVPTIGARVILAAHSMVLGPVVVSEDVTVGAGAVVLDDLAARAVAAGNPAKVITVGNIGRANNVSISS